MEGDALTSDDDEAGERKPGTLSPRCGGLTCCGTQGRKMSVGRSAFVPVQDCRVHCTVRRMHYSFSDDADPPPSLRPLAISIWPAGEGPTEKTWRRRYYHARLASVELPRGEKKPHFSRPARGFSFFLEKNWRMERSPARAVGQTEDKISGY
jgi:hypothetical protein